MTQTMFADERQKNTELMGKIYEQTRIITEMRHKEINHQQISRVSIS